MTDSDSVLNNIAQELCILAEEHQNDSLFLLSLLRDLEQIHRHIRVDYFESALPQTRNDLYQFVKDIEEKGGWPYIERMRLGDVMKNMSLEQVRSNTTEGEDDVEQQNKSDEV